MKKIKQASKSNKFLGREENPFESEMVSQEWIRSVEGEKGMIRDKDIYPRLKEWTDLVSPNVLVEIGAGQGICSEKCELVTGKYIGIEPSTHLVKRAKEKYKNDRRNFLIGNAYDLPIENESADASFSVNVWLHLENLNSASQELARILKHGANFLIITANPETSELWESWYEDVVREGKKIIGKANVPVNPLSRNTFYRHSLQEIVDALRINGLRVEKTETFGLIDDQRAFILITGQKE